MIVEAEHASNPERVAFGTCALIIRSTVPEIVTHPSSTLAFTLRGGTARSQDATCGRAFSARHHPDVGLSSNRFRGRRN
jgi:hypothetical protein